MIKLKNTYSLSFIIPLFILMVSCAKNELIDPNPQLPETSEAILNYEGIEGLIYVPEEFMPISKNPTLKLNTNIDCNGKIVPGGAVRVFLGFHEGLTANIVQVIYSIKKAKESSLSGYFVQDVAPNILGTNFILLGQSNIPVERFTLLLALKDENGVIGEVQEFAFEVIKVATGDLQINLSWMGLDDDLDLYLELPNGNEIFYGDRRGLGSKGNPQYNHEYDLSALLNLSSSTIFPKVTGRACDSGLYNENISIPLESLQEGVYIVRANLFKKCFTGFGVNYVVLARFKDQVIQPITGANPYTSFFDVGADTTSVRYGAGVEVMKFELKSLNGTFDVVPK